MRGCGEQTLGKTSVRKVQIIVLDGVAGEVLAVVRGSVQSHHHANVQLGEEREIVLGHQRCHAVHRRRDRGGTREGEETVLHDPVEVAVLHALVVVVGGDVEVVPVDSALRNGDLKTLHAVLHAEREGA